MRTARALAPVALALAWSACTYAIPGLVQPDSGGAQGDDAPVDSSGDGDDASTDDASDVRSPGDVPVVEANPNVDAACTAVLCACNNGSDCSSRVCGLSLTVGQALFHAAGDTSFCTRPCCTSVQCDQGTVCFASGQGGSYCVNPAWIGRSSPGALQGGSACTADGQCRSGLCNGTTCDDTCCSLADSASECTGSQCVFGTFPGRGIDTHFAGHCGAGGTSPYGVGCTDGTQCQGGLCYANGCTNPCHSPGECGSGNACQLEHQGNDIYAACFPLANTETAAQGANCSNDNQCFGDWCETPAPNLCSNVCISDADCTAVKGWYCRPEDAMLPTGTYDVLVCGP